MQATRIMFWAFAKQCGAPQRRNLLLAMQCRCGTLCHSTVWVRWTLLDSHLGHQMSLPPQFIWVGWGVADFKAQIRAVGVGFTLFRHVQSIQEPQIRLRTPLEQCQYHELFQTVPGTVSSSTRNYPEQYQKLLLSSTRNYLEQYQELPRKAPGTTPSSTRNYPTQYQELP